MQVTSHTGSTRKFVWEFEENKSRVLDAEREGSILELAGARRTCARWGPLELGAKWIRQHRRLCLSSLRRNRLLKVNKKVSYLNKKSLRVFEIPVLYMFCSNEHYMSISHMAIFVYMATQHWYHMPNWSPPPKQYFIKEVENIKQVPINNRSQTTLLINKLNVWLTNKINTVPLHPVNKYLSNFFTVTKCTIIIN